MAVTPGQIYLHTGYYRDDTGRERDKFIVLLGHSAGGDIIFRLLTSRPHGRREDPPCSHEYPYPSYFIGTADGLLRKPTWVDLRPAEDYDEAHFTDRAASGRIVYVGELPLTTACDVMDCAASADDTTIAQERAIRDARVSMECG